jgi:Zn-finger nucleic acid-binding protein
MAECPACREGLVQGTFGGITVDGCHTCGGVWFDRDELTRMARGDLGQLEAMDRAFEAAAGTVPLMARMGLAPDVGSQGRPGSP